jgi:hypothetical protein
MPLTKRRALYSISSKQLSCAEERRFGIKLQLHSATHITLLSTLTPAR